MSIEAAKAFHRSLRENQTLQQQLMSEVEETGEMPNWASLAQANGFDVSEAEADQYLSEEMDGDVELTDFELELVAAGAPSQNGDDGL